MNNYLYIKVQVNKHVISKKKNLGVGGSVDIRIWVTNKSYMMFCFVWLNLICSLNIIANNTRSSHASLAKPLTITMDQLKH